MDKKTYIVLASIFSIAAISIAAIYRNQVKKTFDNIVSLFSRDIEDYLEELPLVAQKKFRSFFGDIEKLGYKIIPTSGYRTFKKQESLHKENTKNAKAGFSYHNYGLAMDINLYKNGKRLTKKSPKSEWEKTGIPRLAKIKYGMRWGGDFSDYDDKVHFDLGNDFDTTKLYADAVKKFGSKDKIEGNLVV